MLVWGVEYLSPRVRRDPSRNTRANSRCYRLPRQAVSFIPQLRGEFLAFFWCWDDVALFRAKRPISGNVVWSRQVKKQGAKPLKLGPLPILAPEEGFEPPTQRLTAACSTTELLRISIGGADRIRTGVHGFAGRCVATPPPRRADALSARSKHAAALRARELRRWIYAGQGTSRPGIFPVPIKRRRCARSADRLYSDAHA
jgi:hypothetical protein